MSEAPIEHTASLSVEAELEAFVAAYEAALARGAAELEHYLPPTEHPRHVEIAAELVRVDLEWRSSRNEEFSLDSYRSLAPAAFDDADARAAMAFEEYRLRRANGEAVERTDYEQRFRVDVKTWPSLELGATRNDATEDSLKQRAERLRWPSAGESLCGFELLEELGRGAFGRVFLARQPELADRPVALKATARRSAEPQRMARLRHTNIMPIYSLHTAGELQLVCMPLLGRTTLAQLMQQDSGASSAIGSGRELVSTLANQANATQIMPDGMSVVGDPRADAARRSSADRDATAAPGLRRDAAMTQLARLDPVQTAVWIGARIAAGLAHAHQRGIIHRDVKPANVLLSEEGEPLLLDFHLADDLAAGLPSALIGGTAPYMPVEQLDAFAGHGSVDQRVDVFALGVILFEMLSGRRPYADQLDGSQLGIETLRRERQRRAPSLRKMARGVSPGLAAIVERCLEPDRRHRYASAVELHEDLTRHLEHRPLRHAKDRSPPERLAKWSRRHPRLSSGATLAALAGILLFAIGALWWSGRESLRRAAALEAVEQVESTTTDATAALNVPGLPAAELERQLEFAKRAFASAESMIATSSRYIRADEQTRLQLARAQLAYLLAAGHAQRAARCAEETTREAAWHQAMSWNSLAASSKSPGDAPQAVVRQRARFLKARGDEQGAAEWLTREGQANAPAFDAYLQAVDWAAEGESERAIERLRQIVADAPRDWNAWFSLGNLLADAERWDESAECYTMCVAIRPDVGWPYLQRGICRLSQKEFARAEADFTSALAIGNSVDSPSSRIGTGEPTESLLVAHWNRALARRGRNDLPGAIDDVSAALRLAPNEPRLWLLRAEYRTAAGELDDATSDRKAGLRLTPNDDIGWVVRGVARLSENDPTGARRDFEQALAINPNNIAALQNLAHVMSEYSGEIDQALALLDRLIAIAPTEPHFVASRGVLLARAGRISEALQEAADVNATVRSISDRPRAGMATYQLACIHALAAKAYESNQTPLETEGAEQRTLVERRIVQRQQDALKLLAQAITLDPQLRKLASSDPDLASLRELPAWSQTLESHSTPANP